MNIFVFDIETVPDVDAGRKLLNLTGLSDHDVAEAMFAQRRQETNGSEFLRHYLHKIVAISCVFRHRDKVNVWSLGDIDASEKDIIERFYEGIKKFLPTLVSWNGSGFDLPVLHYRSLLHGVDASHYWEVGDNDPSFKWNNYINRFQYRHTDLMDVLAGYQARANAPLDQIATLLGFPGKMGMSGAKVWENYQAGDIEGIRNYCETDVLNTFLVYLRFELMRGNLNDTQYAYECELLRNTLAQAEKPHLQEFLDAWRDGSAHSLAV